MPPNWWQVCAELLGLYAMPEPKVVSSIEPHLGVLVETLDPADGGELYYRTCTAGTCRYSSDLWQAILYADQMVGR